MDIYCGCIGKEGDDGIILVIVIEFIEIGVRKVNY